MFADRVRRSGSSAEVSTSGGQSFTPGELQPTATSQCPLYPQNHLLGTNHRALSSPGAVPRTLLEYGRLAYLPFGAI